MAQAPVNRARNCGSRTAELVAVSRARHLLQHDKPYVFEDPYAIRLVGGRWRRILRSPLLDALFSKVLIRRLLPITTQNLTRARFAEECLEESVRNGLTQYVILGSGLDTFAFRRPDLGLTVFEVDLAATIDSKRERLAEANMACPDSLRFVPFDFEKGDLRAELVAAAHREPELQAPVAVEGARNRLAVPRARDPRPPAPWCSPPPSTRRLRDPVTIIDGDTLAVAGQPIWLPSMCSNDDTTHYPPPRRSGLSQDHAQGTCSRGPNS